MTAPSLLPVAVTSSAPGSSIAPPGLAASKRAESPSPSGDSLEQAKDSAATPAAFSPPQLTPPSRATYTDLGLIGVMDCFHQTGETILRSLSQAMQSSSSMLKNLAQENLEKLKAAAENAQAGDFWSLLKKLGQCILSAISLVLGISLVATGAGSVVGAVMIASGLITIANFAMTETGSWDWVAKQLTQDEERRRNLVFWLPMSVGLVGSVLGIGGSIATAIWSSLSMAQQALAIAQATLSFFEGATTIGAGVSQGKLLWSQAELVDLQCLTTLERYFLNCISKTAEALLSHIKSSQDQAEETVRLIAQINQTAVYQG